MLDRIAELRQQGEAAVAGAPDTGALEDVRVRFLGRKAELPNLLRGVAQLPPEERGAVGRAANEARRALDAAIEARKEALEGAELEQRLAADVLDVTLPGSPVAPVGRHHLITATRREIEDVFLGLGFRVVEGPETELVYYNFDALNHAPQHPARLESDTFYVSDDVVLRTHTSPMQVRSMELGRRRCTSSSPAAPTGATTTPRTRRSSTRWRGSRSTRTSRWPTSRARCSRSPARCSATSARCACARTSSRSPSRASSAT
jgi:phenylalanyl-tRNA synthetase alpha chain